MNICEAIERYTIYIKTERRMSEYTVRNYGADLTAFAGYASENHVEDITEVDDRIIRDWMMERMEGHSARDTNRALCSLRGWMKYCRMQGWTEKDPFQKISSIKMEKKLPVFFKEHEVEKIYEAGMFDEGFTGERDKLLLRLLYETGIRRSEAAGLTEGDVDTGKSQIKVLGKRNKERIIPIENELLQNILRFIALKREKGIGEGTLLTNEKGKAMSGEQIYAAVKKYMVPICMEDKISPHVFRHTFATHILNEGGNIDAVKELLGHTDLMATEVYTHVTRQHLKETYLHTHPRALKGKVTKEI